MATDERVSEIATADINSRTFRLALFALLYFVQGAGLAYFRNFQKPYLDEIGIDPDLIGLLTAALLIPFILKIFIGMLSDRVNLFGLGYRKPYIAIGLILAVIAFGGAGLIVPDQNFLLFGIFIVTGSFSAALFDSTTDGLAIDTTPEAEQGLVQSTMVSGRAMGFIILSLIFGSLVGTQGFRVIFPVIAAGMLFPLFLVVRIKEPVQQEPAKQFDWSAFRALTQPAFLIFGLYGIFYSIASYGIDGLVTYFMSNELKLGAVSIGHYGALRGLGAIIGALGSGVVLTRIGRRPGTYLALALVSLIGVLLGLADSAGAVLLLGLFWGVAWGFQETIFVALAMAFADTRIAASMFAMMMALSNIGVAIGEAGATGLVDNISFSAVFWLLAAINLVNVPILWALFKTRGRSSEIGPQIMSGK